MLKTNCDVDRMMPWLRHGPVRVLLFFPKPCTIRWCTGLPSFCLPFSFYFSLGCFHWVFASLLFGFLGFFHSRTWWIKTLPQSPICTEKILLYTVHIKLSLNFVFGVRGSEMCLNQTLCVLKCFMTSIRRQSSEELTFSFVKTLLQSLWYITASGANVLFYCQMSG